MAQPASTKQFGPDLRIMVHETCTIFEGDETVYRYDLPERIVTSDHGLQELVNQAQKVVGPSVWPKAEVVVEAAPGVTGAITAFLTNAGVAAYDIATEELVLPEPQPDKPSLATQLGALSEITEQVNKPLFAGKSSKYVFGGMVLAAIVVVGMLAVSFTLLKNPPQPAVVAAPPTTTSSEVSTASATPTLTTQAAVPVKQQVSFRGLTVPIPLHANLREDQERDLAIVSSDEFSERVMLAVDPAGATANVESLRNQVASSAANDPNLIPGPVLPVFEQSKYPDRVAYSDKYDDGTIVTWVAWFEGGKKISLGCQSPTGQLSPAGADLCTGIVENAVFTP